MWKEKQQDKKTFLLRASSKLAVISHICNREICNREGFGFFPPFLLLLFVCFILFCLKPFNGLSGLQNNGQIP